MTTRDDVRGSLVELGWSLWAELGVSGWGHKHASWLVDPEALIVFTASLGDTDARLRDEATDWCIRYASLISATRLNNLQEHASAGARERLAEIAKAVSTHSSVRWSFASSAREVPKRQTRLRPFEPTNRSRLDSLSTPSLLSLRLRAIFGVGARAEVMRALLEPPGAPCSAADLAEETAFKKRNVAAALDMMQKGGVVESRKVRKELRFQLVNGAAWRELLGAAPVVWPRWHHILPLLVDVLHAGERLRQLAPRVQAVELHRVVDDLTARVAKAHLIPLPNAMRPETLDEWLGRMATGLGRADVAVFRDIDERAQALRDAAWSERASRYARQSRARLAELRDEHAYHPKHNPDGRVIFCPSCSVESVVEVERDVGLCTEWTCREIHRLRPCLRCGQAAIISEDAYCDGCSSYIGDRD
jgi:hypothetical protein